MPIHVANMIELWDLPRDCILDCTVPGQPADEPVAFWREQLDVTVDRAAAIRCLKGTGAWEDSALALKTDDELAEIVLWLACGDFREFLDDAERKGFDPYSNFDVTLMDDPEFGSTLFILE